jgi:hypothetical protein
MLLEMVYTKKMANSSKPSAGVIAAGIVAILAGLCTLLVTVFTTFAMLVVRTAPTAPAFPAAFRNVMILTLIFMACLSGFGIATGIGLFFLKNWARISILVWGGLSIFFGAFGVAIAAFLPMPVQPETPGVNALAFRVFLFGFYALPLGVGLWWAILFTRRAVKEQFSRAAAPATVELPMAQKPRCPIPVAVIAWFYISTAANTVILPFLPYRFPAIFFGREIPGTWGLVLLVALCVAFVIAGIGLLKLRAWSYTFTISLQLLLLLSGTVSVLSPNYDSLITSGIAKINEAMHLPSHVYQPFDYSHYLRAFTAIGLLIPVVILVLLFYYRLQFLEAASAAEA